MVRGGRAPVPACVRGVRGVLLLALVGSLGGTSAVAVGQERGAGRAERAPVADEAPGEGSGATQEQAEADQDVAEEEQDEGGQKVKVFEFGGLDITGELKSPQLLYFLNRLRAEFDRPKLPHRSFIPELEKSAEGEAFR